MNNEVTEIINYLNEYEVFFLSDLFVSKISDKPVSSNYMIGDYIPICNYNYIYNSKNILIIDYRYKVVHIIINSIYREIIKVKNDSIELDSQSYLYKILSSKESFMSIDIYGNLLKVRTIKDLMGVLITYPKVNVYLTENKYLNTFDHDDCDNEVLIEDIMTVDYRNEVIIRGTYKSNLNHNERLHQSFEISELLQKSILDKLMEEYYSRWILEDSTLNEINEFLTIIRLYYICKINGINRPFVYYNGSNKECSHIDKIINNLKLFISSKNEDEINLLLETIFLSVEYEENYEDFIISTVSKFLNI